jgi:hypothetical protein
MDWIKVLNKHILFEYNDLRDSEFVAWIKIMALTAELEHEPTRQQILKYVNYQTLDSLSSKLQKHSIDLPSILHKVLIDASYVRHRRDVWKNNKKQYREDMKNVLMDVSMSVSNKEKDIEKEKDIVTPIAPKKKGAVYTEDFLIFYKAYPKKKAPDAAWKAWKNRNGTRPPIEVIIAAIENQKQSDQWLKDNGQFIPHPATWLNQGRWADETKPTEKWERGVIL